MKFLVLLALAFLLSGCSSFKLGSFCYLPYGVSGICDMRMAPPPPPEPQLPA